LGFKRLGDQGQTYRQRTHDSGGGGEKKEVKKLQRRKKTPRKSR